MKYYKADLHIHTCLSPCGDLDMSPRKIIARAKEMELDMIAITDHNTTRNVRPCFELGREHGIFVIGGCEVNSREEVHCLAYFPDFERLDAFQSYIDEKLPPIPNNPDYFGHQVAVDVDDNIIYVEERSLFTGIDDDIESIAEKVLELDGVFIPAHIERPKNSIFSQLGFLPPDLKYHALEVSWRTTVEDFVEKHPRLAGETFVQNSDAHYLEDIGKRFTQYCLCELDWENFAASFGKAKCGCFKNIMV